MYHVYLVHNLDLKKIVEYMGENGYWTLTLTKLVTMALISPCQFHSKNLEITILKQSKRYMILIVLVVCNMRINLFQSHLTMNSYLAGVES